MVESHTQLPLPPPPATAGAAIATAAALVGVQGSATRGGSNGSKKEDVQHEDMIDLHIASGSTSTTNSIPDSGAKSGELAATAERKEQERKEAERKAAQRIQLRWDAVAAFNEFGSYEEAAAKVGKSKGYVRKWVEQHTRLGHVDDGPRSGRPQKDTSQAVPFAKPREACEVRQEARDMALGEEPKSNFNNLMGGGDTDDDLLTSPLNLPNGLFDVDPSSDDQSHAGDKGSFFGFRQSSSQKRKRMDGCPLTQHLHVTINDDLLAFSPRGDVLGNIQEKQARELSEERAQIEILEKMLAERKRRLTQQERMYKVQTKMQQDLDARERMVSEREKAILKLMALEQQKRRTSSITIAAKGGPPPLEPVIGVWQATTTVASGKFHSIPQAALQTTAWPLHFE